MFTGTPLRLEKSLPQAGLEPGTARSADQRSPLSYCGLGPEKKQFVIRNAIMSNYDILGMTLYDAHVRRLSKVLSLHIMFEQWTRTFCEAARLYTLSFLLICTNILIFRPFQDCLTDVEGHCLCMYDFPVPSITYLYFQIYWLLVVPLVCIRVSFL